MAPQRRPGPITMGDVTLQLTTTTGTPIVGINLMGMVATTPILSDNVEGIPTNNGTPGDEDVRDVTADRPEAGKAATGVRLAPRTLSSESP